MLLKAADVICRNKLVMRFINFTMDFWLHLQLSSSKWDGEIQNHRIIRLLSFFFGLTGKNIHTIKIHNNLGKIAEVVNSKISCFANQSSVIRLSLEHHCMCPLLAWINSMHSLFSSLQTSPIFLSLLWLRATNKESVRTMKLY